MLEGESIGEEAEDLFRVFDESASAGRIFELLQQARRRVAIELLEHTPHLLLMAPGHLDEVRIRVAREARIDLTIFERQVHAKLARPRAELQTKLRRICRETIDVELRIDPRGELQNLNVLRTETISNSHATNPT